MPTPARPLAVPDSCYAAAHSNPEPVWQAPIL